MRNGSEKFERVLATVREVGQLGMELCVTLGQLGDVEAEKLKTAGVTAYNHNIDTSPEFYTEIVTTHTFQDRLDTIGAVQRAGMSVCSGGIIGMGESEDDRLRMMEVLSNFDPQPESVPINCLMAMPGTPLAGQAPVRYLPARAPHRGSRASQIRAPASVLPPGAPASRAKVRRSASSPVQTRSSFGDKLLTAENPAPTADVTLLRELGLNIETTDDFSEIGEAPAASLTSCTAG